MQNIPKIVLERLQVAPTAGAHPDADVLTAFAERSLSELERDVVLEHVARCGECRDVIVLAFPETEAALPALVPARTSWFTWPALRWGLVSAGVVALALAWFGVQQYSRPERAPTMLAKATVPDSPAAPEAKVEPAAQAGQNERDKNLSSDSSASGAARLTLAAPASNLKAPAPRPIPTVGDTRSSPVRSLGRNIGGPVPPGLKMPLQQQQQNAANMNGFAAPAVDTVAPAKQRAGDMVAEVPAVSETVEVQGAAVQFDRPDEKQSAQAPATVQPSSADEESRVGKAKAAPGTSAGIMQLTAEAPSAMAVPRVEMAAVALTSPPRWTIGADGDLERSFDQGHTWQDVDVNAASTPANNSYSVEVAAPARARKKDADKDKKDQGRGASAPVFRAVAANGAEVWAGGSEGALYHSVDAGNRWTRVALVSSGTPVSGDIVSVEFANADQGKITTSTGEVWATIDAGRTWKKR